MGNKCTSNDSQQSAEAEVVQRVSHDLLTPSPAWSTDEPPRRELQRAHKSACEPEDGPDAENEHRM